MRIGDARPPDPTLVQIQPTLHPAPQLSPRVGDRARAIHRPIVEDLLVHLLDHFVNARRRRRTTCAASAPPNPEETQQRPEKKSHERKKFILNQSQPTVNKPADSTPFDFSWNTMKMPFLPGSFWISVSTFSSASASNHCDQTRSQQRRERAPGKASTASRRSTPDRFQRLLLWMLALHRSTRKIPQETGTRVQRGTEGNARQTYTNTVHPT